MSIYAAYLYDAVKLYAKGLGNLLHAKGSNLTAGEIELIVKDGKGIIDAIKNLKNYTSKCKFNSLQLLVKLRNPKEVTYLFEI